MRIAVFAAGYIAATLLVALIPAGVASRKGRSFVGWWVLGALFFVPVLIASLVINPDTTPRPPTDRQCRNCAATLNLDATKCAFCGHQTRSTLQLLDDLLATGDVTPSEYNRLRQAELARLADGSAFKALGIQRS